MTEAKTNSAQQTEIERFWRHAGHMLGRIKHDG